MTRPGMRFHYENPPLEQRLAEVRTGVELDAALTALFGLVPSFLEPPVRGRQMFAPGLDALIPDLARRLSLKDAPARRSNERVVILGTRFFAQGGHSRVARDIATQVGGERVSVICTDLKRQLRYRMTAVQGEFNIPHRSVHFLLSDTLPEKILELYNLLAAIRPTRIFLMNNHTDAVAVVAAWPFRSVVDFVHHADHLPCLGATLPFASHVDVTYGAHLACREAGVAATYVAMEAAGPDPALRRAAPAASADRPLRFATCGGEVKFRNAIGHTWPDYAVAALSAHPGSEFLHIGDTSEPFRSAVEDALAAAGLDAARYRFIGTVASLPDALVGEAVDVYVSSYPQNGARANLEAMLSGFAPIVPMDPDLGPLNQYRFPLESWIGISDPREMGSAVGRVLALQPSLRDGELRDRLLAHQARFPRFVADEPVEPMALSETLP